MELVPLLSSVDQIVSKCKVNKLFEPVHEKTNLGL